MSRDSIMMAIRDANRNSTAVIPSRAQPATQAHVSRAHLTAGFVAKAEASGIVIERLGGLDAVPKTIAKHLRLAGIAPRLRHGCDPIFAAVSWDQAPELERRQGAATDDDRASVSRARYGVCETGTLVLASGPDNPVTLAFMPDVHILLLNEADIVSTLDEALANLCAAAGPLPLPRTINLISGASRTGDIGGHIVMGAHGPRHLVVLLISS